MSLSGDRPLVSATQLQTWVEQARPWTHQGHLPTYIPRLAQVDRSWLAIAVASLAGEPQAAGDLEPQFCLMSVVKPLLLLFLLEQLGSVGVFRQVGFAPSEQPFNSLAQLEADQGWPRNPMLNSGAIALAALLPGTDAVSRAEGVRQWLNLRAGCELRLDPLTLASVRQVGNPQNAAIAESLAQSGYLATSVPLALDTYNQLCCLQTTVLDLARLGLLLAQERVGIATAHRRIVNALMLTCGLYQASSEFALRLGLPTKSGVSGALLSVVPGWGAIAIYSPALDPVGNSIAGLFLLEQLVQTLNLSPLS